MHNPFLKDKERRLVAVPISNGYLIDMLREDFHWKHEYKCITGVPKDAVMITDYFDFMAQRAMIVFYHPSFAIVKEGEILPVLNVRYELITPSNTAWSRLVEGWANFACRVRSYFKGESPA
jgi:hypothetical protein